MKRNAPGSKSSTNNDHNTHTQKSRDRLFAEWAKQLTICFQYDGPSFNGILKTVTPTIAKQILTCKKSLTLSIYPLCYAILPMEIIWRPEIHKGYISINWNYCVRDTFTAWQTNGNWNNTAQYCPQTIHYIVQPCNIKTRHQL